MSAQIYIFLFLLSIFECNTELGGVKVAINETLFYEGLKTFFDNITEFLKEKSIDEQRFFRGCNARNLKFGVKNFDPSSVFIQFRSSDLHVTIRSLNAWITGRIDSSFLLIPFHNNADIDIRIHFIEFALKFGTQKNKKGKWIPSVDFIGPIKYDFTYTVDVDGIGGGFIASLGGSKAYDKIQEFMSNDVQSYVKDFVNNMDMEIAIDEKEGYYLDYSLVGKDGIRMKDGFIEVNSYARLYNKKVFGTDGNKYSLSQLPIITKMEKDFQLYVSQYSIQYALHTYFKTTNFINQLFSNVFRIEVIKVLFPDIQKKYGNQKIDIKFNPTEYPYVTLSEESMTFQVNSELIINANNKKVFNCNLGMILSFEIHISEGPIISAKIHNISIKVLEHSQLYYIQKEERLKIESAFLALNSLILPVINPLIEQKIKFPFSSFKGINFKNLSFEHKEQYLVVNFSVERVIRNIFSRFLRCDKEYLEKMNSFTKFLHIRFCSKSTLNQNKTVQLNFNSFIKAFKKTKLKQS